MVNIGMDTAESTLNETSDTLPERQAALVALVTNGLTIKQAAKQLGYKYSSARSIMCKKGLTRSKQLNDYVFTGNKKSQKRAYDLVNAFASGKLPKETDIKNLKCSTALGAAKYISDHNDPVIKTAEDTGNQVNNYTQIININEFRVPEPVKVIDSPEE